MNISENGLKFIENKEGFSLKSYKDSAGFWTIGYGHLITGTENPPIACGGEITMEYAIELLKNDVKSVVDDFNENDGLSDIPGLTQEEFDACVSLAFNIGINAFDESTALRMIEEHNFSAAGNAILLWNKCAGRVVQGLVNRRNAERDLFLNGNYGKK